MDADSPSDKSNSPGNTSWADFVAATDVELPPWLPEEYGSVLAHFWQTSLAEIPGSESRTLSVGECLSLAQPREADLIAIKEFGKGCASGQGALPAEVAAVAYLAAIASGNVRLSKQISTTPTKELRARYRWALQLPWLLNELVALFEDASGSMHE